jgi:ABC-type multidrug transport system ATPase subunit
LASPWAHGTVRRGKTVRVGLLDQRATGLDAIGDDLVRVVLGRLQTVFLIGKHELSPSQLLERLGFDRVQLSTPVRDLSGGERRRLQLLLVLCAEPNVLILDEPTNDVDTDMLAALEDFLDSWPGTLIVVSHDRYLVERVTDQQYALLDGRLRHLPGGVDDYLARLAAPTATVPPPRPATTESAAASDRATRKTLASLERRIARVTAEIAALHGDLAAHDPTDYLALADLAAQADAKAGERDALETAWLETAEGVAATTEA